jgi:hypothetical protein
MSSPTAIERIEGSLPELREFIEHTRTGAASPPEPKLEIEPKTVEEPTRTPREFVELIEKRIHNIRNKFFNATHMDIGISREDRLLQYAEWQLMERVGELKEAIDSGTAVFDNAEIGTLHVKNLIMPGDGFSLPTMSRFFPGMPSLPNLGQPSHNFKIK